MIYTGAPGFDEAAGPPRPIRFFPSSRKGEMVKLSAPLPADMTEVIQKLWGSLDVLKEV